MLGRRGRPKVGKVQCSLKEQVRQKRRAVKAAGRICHNEGKGKVL